MEQVIKLTGRVVKVFPAQSGVSARTGNAWMSRSFYFSITHGAGPTTLTESCAASLVKTASSSGHPRSWRIT